MPVIFEPIRKRIWSIYYSEAKVERLTLIHCWGKKEFIVEKNSLSKRSHAEKEFIVEKNSLLKRSHGRHAEKEC